MSSGSESEAIARFREAVRTEKVTVSVQTHPYTEFRNIAVNWGNGLALEVWQNIAMQTFGDHCGETLLKRHNEDGIIPPSEILDLVDEILDEQ
jgi:hypothetical protein